MHAEDAREYLMEHPDIGAEQIAVKTSARDDLKEVDDAGGLLARDCQNPFHHHQAGPCRRGGDCAFAYVLAILTRPSSKSALTQLVGRILRQPYARKTGERWLDESYVFCFQRQSVELLREVRRGFDREGLGDLQPKVADDGDSPMEPAEPVVRRQRARFRRAAPRSGVSGVHDSRRRHMASCALRRPDILSRTPWDEVDVTPLYDLPLGERPGDDIQMQVGVDGGVAAASTHATPDRPTGGGSLDHAFAASHLLDVMPNPWRGSEVARRVFGGLLDRHPRALVVSNYGFVLEEIRKRLEIERDRLARAVFMDLLEASEMRFIVAAEDLGFNRLPRKIRSAPDRQANRADGAPYQLNLFDRTDESELNELENRVATFLDQQERLFFWYRNRPAPGLLRPGLETRADLRRLHLHAETG